MRKGVLGLSGSACDRVGIFNSGVRLSEGRGPYIIAIFSLGLSQ